ncbi:MAG: hypothetical protein ACSHX9_00160 [Luteolibacter sp.]
MDPDFRITALDEPDPDLIFGGMFSGTPLYLSHPTLQNLEMMIEKIISTRPTEADIAAVGTVLYYGFLREGLPERRVQPRVPHAGTVDPTHTAKKLSIFIKMTTI